MSTTFEKTPHRTAYRRRINDGDRVLLAMIAFAVALGLILLGAYLRADTPSAPSADFGATMMKADQARVGERAPGTAPRKTQNAAESILSHDLAGGAAKLRDARRNAPASLCNDSARYGFFEANSVFGKSGSAHHGPEAVAPEILLTAPDWEHLVSFERPELGVPMALGEKDPRCSVGVGTVKNYFVFALRVRAGSGGRRCWQITHELRLLPLCLSDGAQRLHVVINRNASNNGRGAVAQHAADKKRTQNRRNDFSVSAFGTSANRRPHA